MLRRSSGPSVFCGGFSLAEQIDAQVAGDGDDPAAELRAVPKLADALESLDHRVLGDVLGIVDIAQNAEADQKDGLVVPLDQHGVRRPVSPDTTPRPILCRYVRPIGAPQYLARSNPQ